MKYWRKWLCFFMAALVVGTCIPVSTPFGSAVPVEVQAAAQPKLNKTSVSLNVGKTYTLKLKNATKVTWKSNNKKIAKVSSKGKITAVKAGTTKVYAVYKGKKYYCKVTVKKTATAAPVVDSADERAKTEKGREELAKEAAAAIIKAEGMEALSPVEKVKAAHDYLVLNAEYDQENLAKDTLPDEAFEAYGILVQKIGVCAGYAKAFQIFMDLLGVECEYVTGYAGGVGHAWNAVTLDGERYHVDTTWDDPVPDQKGYVQYNYFLLDDKAMSADHTWTFLTEACTGTKYRTYPYEAMGIKAENLTEAKKIIKRQYEAGTPEKFDIQLLVPVSVTESQILSYLGEIWEKEGNRGYYKYPVTRIGNYNYYHYFTETEK